MAPSTFASAAAGNNQSHNSTRDGSSEWPRRPNGATQTFRRPSQANPAMSQSSTNAVSDAQSPARYVPPHRNGNPSNAPVDSLRYSKSQLLDLYKSQQREDGGLEDGLKDLYVGGWQPELANGSSSSAGGGWGNAAAQQSGGGTEIIWERSGDIGPLGLLEMDEEERELFVTTVNTPIKPPTQGKDSTQSNGLPGRKISISQSINSPGGFGQLSPTTTRPPRRRDTSDSYGFPNNAVTSPTNPGFDRTEGRAASPPLALTRRRTDMKETTKSEERDKPADEKSSGGLFGSLKRSTTGGLSGGTGFNAPSSPWSNTTPSAAFPPMGSFGNFGIGGGGVAAPAPTSTEKRPGFGGGRAESRFKNLLSKESSEEVTGSVKPAGAVEPKSSMSSLPKVNENESWRPQHLPHPDETDEEISLHTGSAALAAGSDVSPPYATRQQSLRSFDTPSRGNNRDDSGFGAFGMHPDTHVQAIAPSGFGALGRDAFEQTPNQRSGQPGGNEPMSPTDTNPFQSPDQRGYEQLLAEESEDDVSGMFGGGQAHRPGGSSLDPQQQQTQGAGGFGGLGGLAGLGAGRGTASDRSQTGSTGPTRTFSGLGGLGNLVTPSGSNLWPVSQGGLGTPGQRTAGLSGAFGGGIFATSTMGELQSPSLAGLGSAGGFGGLGGLPSAGLGGPRGGFGGGFPNLMHENRESSPFQGQGLATQQAEQKQHHPEGQMESFFQQQHQQGGGLSVHQQQHQPQQPQGPADQTPQQQQQAQQQQQSDTLPPPQQRTMVMPDRMRWIYRDPQGQTQGPWSGLEMHDWYKAGFFSPELLVKKAEDLEYEPLAQLIRRIGNSREPFLVPQIGIPHGPSATASQSGTQGAGWAGGMGASVPALGNASVGQSGVAPPFASSFPSFGTTLTAEQQNALERRKQEEQYLMARQKEHLAQAQMAQRMQHMHGQGSHGPSSGNLFPNASSNAGQLHHTSSAQSLHSQPSFGSMTSPGPNFQPSPVQGPAVGGGHVAGFPFSDQQQASFNRGQAQGPLSGGGVGAVGAGVDNLGHIREEEIPGIMDRLTVGQRQGQSAQFGAPGQPSFMQHQQLQQGQQQRSNEDVHSKQVQQMMQDRERLAREQAAANDDERDDEDDTGRLTEFRQLQGQQSGKMMRVGDQTDSATAVLSVDSSLLGQQKELPSLTEQVKNAASAKQSPVPPQVWKQVEAGIPQPFPPAPSQSPLPAPAAQRTSRQSVADHLHAESRSRSQTPSVDTPSAAAPAPWAKEQSELSKGPSLKEIQEAEAKRAAEAEELAVAARRAVLQKEMEAQAAATAAQQPGLPASSKWATGAQSPGTPTGSSPWATKPVSSKTVSGTVKTMAQIQKEEEARKKKLAAVQAQALAQVAGSGPAPSVGKSYANTAGKTTIAPPPGMNVGGAWTTVGASGKTKTPAGSTPPAAPVRSVSQALPSGPAPKKTPTRSATMTGVGTGGPNAQDELKKWAINELKPDLTKGASAEDIVASLVFLPPDTEIITEAVHGVSQTIDSRHFAEEFIRRKKLADKGLVDTSAPPKSSSPATATQGTSNGGWNEVAKKGPSKAGGVTPQEEAAGNGSFRVVPAKKKGGKK